MGDSDACCPTSLLDGSAGMFQILAVESPDLQHKERQQRKAAKHQGSVVILLPSHIAPTLAHHVQKCSLNCTTYPDANKSDLGFHAQIKTSDVWLFSTDEGEGRAEAVSIPC